MRGTHEDDEDVEEGVALETGRVLVARELLDDLLDFEELVGPDLLRLAYLMMMGTMTTHQRILHLNLSMMQRERIAERLAPEPVWRKKQGTVLRRIIKRQAKRMTVAYKCLMP